MKAPALLALLAAVAPPALPAVTYTDTSRLGRPFAKDPSVVRFRGRYLLYYSLPPAAGGAGMRGWAIGIAASHDLARWRKIGEMLPEQAIERNGIAAPGAVVIGGRVHLFYQTYGNGPRDAINHAWSDDGVRFVREPTNPVFRPASLRWSVGRAIDADAIVVGDRLRLYYATRDPTMSRQLIGVADAPLADGLVRGTWRDLSVDRPALAPEMAWEKNCVEAPSVMRRGERWFMFYAGGYNNEPQQIGVATSSDGLRWTRLSNRPFLANGPPGSWNASESGHPGIFVDRGKTWLFYQGNGDKGRTWTIARAAVRWKDAGPSLR